MIEIDAGSSGSRAYLYQYDADTSSKVTQIQEVMSKKVKPGLSSFADNPNGAIESIDNLLAPVKAQLEQGGVAIKTVTVNILATGGMRSIPEEKQTAIYQGLRRELKNNLGFLVGRVATISGEEEGRYLWLTINHLKHAAEGDSSVGILDMGGASSQIAFAGNVADSHETVLDGKQYSVFAKSILGLGSEHMRLAVNVPSCYPRNYQMSDGELGAGDYATCHALMLKQAKSLIGSYQFPKADKVMSFMAVSSFKYAADYLELNSPLNTTDLETATKTFCESDWIAIKEKYKDKHYPEKYLSAVCSQATNVAVALEVYGLSQHANIYTIDNVDGISTDWVMGALIDQLNS